ncbi:MAG TPA: Na+/H+ antiporter NhaC family protein [Xanthomonadales bacterium]|nr:Na+/H+ antiporter NhaC family protein [Xanthomonadales bacterium]
MKKPGWWHNGYKWVILITLLGTTSVFAQEADAPAVAGSWISILPPLLAIVMALVFRQVIPALFLGLWLGAWAVRGFDFYGLWMGLLDSFQVHLLNSFADADKASIILFSLMIGGTVGIISRNGGMHGIVRHIVRWADNARHACIATATMGLAIFFDDYANTLVVGNTMRPVTDSMRISRAKLAYLVDSTAAPVACLFLVTTWIGYEVGLIGDALSFIPDLNAEAYLVFLSTIPFSFYPILCIIFVFMIAWSGRDFGPMFKSEEHAQKFGSYSNQEDRNAMAEDCEPIEPMEGKPQRAINAIIPIFALVAGVMGGLYVTGLASSELENPTLRDIIGAANSYTALMWGSLIGMVVAVLMTLTQRIMGLEEVVNAWYKGMRSMLYAMIILLLAWSLGGVTEILQTAEFLVAVLGETLPVTMVPLLVFLLAAGTAFATGSSWGSMGILIPLVIPLTWAIMKINGMAGPEDMHLLYSSIACVLAGSVWGDHCSPISDTTILSSMASGCDHIEHVRTQLPYALVVGIVALVAGTVPAAFGMPWWLCIVAGAGILLLVLRIFGKPQQQ